MEAILTILKNLKFMQKIIKPENHKLVLKSDNN